MSLITLFLRASYPDWLENCTSLWTGILRGHCFSEHLIQFGLEGLHFIVNWHSQRTLLLRTSYPVGLEGLHFIVNWHSQRILLLVTSFSAWLIKEGLHFILKWNLHQNPKQLHRFSSWEFIFGKRWTRTQIIFVLLELSPTSSPKFPGKEVVKDTINSDLSSGHFTLESTRGNLSLGLINQLHQHTH